MHAEIIKEYDTTLDTKHRITVRSGKRLYKNYHVRVYRDGRVLIEPRILVNPKFLSKRALQMMDKAMINYNKGIRSDPLDTGEMRKAADALPD